MGLFKNSRKGSKKDKWDNKAKSKSKSKSKPKTKYNIYGPRTFGNSTIKVKDPTEYGHFYKKSGYNQPTKKRPNYSRAKRRRAAINEALFISGAVILFLIVTIVVVDIILKALNSDNTPASGPAEDAQQVTISENNIVDLAFPEEEIILDPALLSQDTSPTSISLTWEDTTDTGYVVMYRQSLATVNEAHGLNHTEDNTHMMMDICTAYFEGSDTSGIEDPAHGWMMKATNEPYIELSGLEPSSMYDVHILYADETLGEYLPASSYETTASGYCDPFKAVDSLLNIPVRDEATGIVQMMSDTTCVQMTASNGCIGAEAKPVMNISLYSDPSMSSVIDSASAGSSLFISSDPDGHSCYRTDSDGWYVFVQSESGTRGWVNARTLLVDVGGIFDSATNIYGIQINRTNAVASIFTCGGNAHAVNDYSSAESRYDAVSSNDAPMFTNTDGYNVIDGITNQKLPNYGRSDQMPVIWDLALELKQCQKSALENGYTLLMYEGYRPLSTSAAVSGNLSQQGHLSTVVYGTDLAKGFLTDQPYNVSYYIAQKSRHNRGIATDLTLVRFNSTSQLGNEEMMQTKMHTLDYRCNMSYNNWKADLLSDIMIGHGSHLEYLTVRSEWWHFQLKTDRVDLYPMIDQYGYVDFEF